MYYVRVIKIQHGFYLEAVHYNNVKKLFLVFATKYGINYVR